MYEHLREAREALVTKRTALPPGDAEPIQAAPPADLRALPADTKALRKSYTRKPTLSSFK